jgi:hypothetical protein
MTRAAAGSPPASTLEPHLARDLRTPTRWFLAILMPIGPASIAVLRFVMPYNTTDSSRVIVAKVVAHPAAEKVVLWMTFVAVFTLLPGAIAAIRLTRRRAPVLAATTAVLLIGGYLASSVLAVADEDALTAATRGIDHATVARIIDLVNDQPSVNLLTTIFVAGHLLGVILLACALRRSRQIPLIGALILGVSQPLHLTAALTGEHPLDLLAWGMTAIGMTFAARALLRTADDDWDLPPAPAP